MAQNGQLIPPGRRFYGIDIGILVLDAFAPRPIGDIGNARTFDFPVLYHAVRGADPRIIVEQGPRELLHLFVDAARELVQQGVSGITTTCGFLAAVQPELAAATGVPIMTSSLLQIPMVLRSLGPDNKIVVVTANAKTLGDEHFAGAGVGPHDRHRISVVGVEDCSLLYPHLMSRSPGPLDVGAVAEEIVGRCVSAARDDAAVTGFVFECANFPPYAAAVRAATGLPVWDAVGMTVQLWRSVRRDV